MLFCWHILYSLSTFNQPHEWRRVMDKNRVLPPLPPNFGKKKSGRPTMKRRLGADEGGSGKKKRGVQVLPKQKRQSTCKFCKEKGHTENNCQWKKLADDFVADEEAGEGTSMGAGEVHEEMRQTQQIPPVETHEDPQYIVSNYTILDLIYFLNSVHA